MAKSTTDEAPPVMDTANLKKPTEATETRPSAETAIPTATAPQTTTTAQNTQPSTTEPTPPPSTSGTDTTATSTVPLTASSTDTKGRVPTLEKEELDFSGNVDVNDDLPSEADLERVGDLLLLDNKGASRPFKDVYNGVGIAPRQMVIFVRHFFCGQCQEYLRTLSSSITPESLLALPTPTFITVIGCGRPELIDMYVETTACPFPVYADPSKKLYDYLGMTRTLNLGKKPNYIQSNLFVTSLQSVVQSLKMGDKALKGGNYKQVGGEFLFENGECRWVHRMRNTRDHAEVEVIRGVIGLDVQKPPMRKRWSHGIKEEKENGGRLRSASWGRKMGRSKSKAAKENKEGSLGTRASTPEHLIEEREDERALDEDAKWNANTRV
ncbi:hypothetical protein K504DRAFT_466657 [Pleomassaria siparia CBS 279.74]|uniref:AhpC-TSA-domain-containing protein n=1 Tax=Pleomassaria siparia CBS 279.74 TaxID=1314801 RepID=A0A6G1KBG3_9PLEO|nr:hypothetical protein K504DRAFT_466657 [Pleomassaria siparia CBS 279.74]